MLYTISTWAIPIILAITLHEAAHGYVANFLGDNTAKALNRVSLNPFRHIDLMGTVIVPLFLALTSPFILGWAKPVPVNFNRLGKPKRDMVWVAAAGPAINLFLALLSARLLYVAPLLPTPAEDWTIAALRNSILVNVLLAVFNLIPLPPLDGGRIAVGILPISLARRLAQLEKYGMFLIIGILIVLPLLGSLFGRAIKPFEWVILPIVDAVISVIATLAGFI